MTWVVSLVVAVLSALFGVLFAGTVAALLVEWYDISSFEGGSGYFVVFMALGGGIAGFVIGLISSRVILARPKPAFWKQIGLSTAVIVVLSGLAAGVARLVADVPPEIDGQTLFVQVELRWPDGQAPSPEMRARQGIVTLGALSGSVVRLREDGPLFTDRAAVVDNHWVVPGEAFVATERGRRLLMFQIGETQLPAHILPLPRRPWHEHRKWSAWLPEASAASTAEGFRYRFKLRLANEPLRVDRVGPFAIDTRVRGYYQVVESDRLAAQSTFAIRYHDAPVAGLDDVEVVSVIPGNAPALLVKADVPNHPGMCHLVREQNGAAQVTTIAECALPGSVSPLTADQARFDAARRSTPLPGWIDDEMFAQAGLYRISQFILDTRTLTTRKVVYLSNYSPHGSVPPLSLSPDERSFVVLTSDYERNHQPALVVIGDQEGQSYPLAIDRVRMRFNDEKDLGPAWVAHHFAWEPGDRGDRLVQRSDFMPLPHHGELALGKPGEYQSYTLRPGGAPLREAIVRLLVERMGAEPVADAADSYRRRVRIEGKELSITLGERPSYVNVSMDGPAGDRALMERVAKTLDAIIATGELDALFVEP
jgi:hypothetical protein